MSFKAFIQRHPVTTYFGMAFLIPYGGYLVLVGPKLIRGETMQPMDAFILFPIIVVGVCLVSIALTGIIDGRRGLRDLFSRTGFFEEVGWMGFAFPRMRVKHSPLAAGVLLGVLWGLWHAPVVDYLGAAAPHGVYWAPFFLAFIAILMAMRVLIVWVYTQTNSLLLAQLMHASSTGFLIILSASRVSPAQEALWYAVYAAVLWIVVAFVVARYGKRLAWQPGQMKTA